MLEVGAKVIPACAPWPGWLPVTARPPHRARPPAFFKAANLVALARQCREMGLREGFPAPGKSPTAAGVRRSVHRRIGGAASISVAHGVGDEIGGKSVAGNARSTAFADTGKILCPIWNSLVSAPVSGAVEKAGFTIATEIIKRKRTGFIRTGFFRFNSSAVTRREPLGIHAHEFGNCNHHRRQEATIVTGKGIRTPLNAGDVFVMGGHDRHDLSTAWIRLCLVKHSLSNPRMGCDRRSPKLPGIMRSSNP